MFALAAAALFALLLLFNVREDRRRLSNAVLLGLALVSLALAVLSRTGRLPGDHASLTSTPTLLAAVLGSVLLAGLLLANSRTMVRKEGTTPTSLLSAALAVAILLVNGLVLFTVREDDSRGLTVLTLVLVLWGLYFAFVLLCFLGYAFLYGRAGVSGDVDYVVVLGAGLAPDGSVPPLLASRLEKGRRIYRAQVERGAAPPVLLPSGGQGSDERRAEARAMAEWLRAEGVPERDVRLEDRSRNTAENMAFSQRIMAEEKPEHRCVVVTNNFHVFRAAISARRAGVNGQVVGCPTARYFWLAATLREFVAVIWEYRMVNLLACGLIAAVGLIAP
ncbi:YdcF family protein [Streptomyces sp. NPDC005438]|uniref:YdcF family protein n=1 Tax=Streptomyces sp. NPDC005438 TaxID=3156880 RepID=UPI0033A90827